MSNLNHHNYYVYILTNLNKTVLYIGVTNSLERRIAQHKETMMTKTTFASKYNCIHLVYMEHFKYINDAIAREKMLKGWTRIKKNELINTINPDWIFLNENW